MSPNASKSVAVIGAGISGVTAAAHLQREGFQVTVFERSHAAGGVWLFDERISLEPKYPSIVASKAEEYYDTLDPTLSGVANGEYERLVHAPPGPCYWGLMNNVATRLLETTLQRFPPDTPDYVSHSSLKEYIQSLAQNTGVSEHILYDTKVENVGKIGEHWRFNATTLRTGPDGAVSRELITQDFDSVVVASGHYSAARIPNIPGISKWKHSYPNQVQHSKGYRRPDTFKGKNVLLIGGSVSANDIARELEPFADQIYQSTRSGAFDLPASLLPENAVRVDEIESFGPISKLPAGAPGLPGTIPATITLKSGRVLCNIHHVIVCSGYNTTLPFFPQFHSDSTAPQDADHSVLVTDGNQLHNLHKDIFYIPDPSLAFVGKPYYTATFTLFEFQAIVVAKAFAGKAKIPSQEAMREEYEKRVAAKGYGKGFHSLKEKEVDYVNELLEWVNADLEDAGIKKIEGHTPQWHEARKEMVARMKERMQQGETITRELRVSCG